MCEAEHLTHAGKAGATNGASARVPNVTRHRLALQLRRCTALL